MNRETQVEIVNICIVNALRLDEEHRMMILKKLTQKLSGRNQYELIKWIKDFHDTATPVAGWTCSLWDDMGKCGGYPDKCSHCTAFRELDK